MAVDLQCLRNNVLHHLQRFAELSFGARKLDQKPDSEKVLLRSLAAAQLALQFEQIHGIIWNGQIELLETLNTIPDGVELSVIEGIYNDKFRGQRPFYTNIEFGTYTAWLLAKSLILIDNRKIGLTRLGRGYLKWIVENGRAKPSIG